MSDVSIAEFSKLLEQAGYIRPPRELVLAAIAAFKAAQPARPQPVLLQGPPGAGKTFFAEAVARAAGWLFEYTLLTEFADPQTLIEGLDVGKALSGDAEGAVVKGPVVRAATAERCVLCLDEIDKAPPRVENMFLRFLENGFVEFRGETLHANRLVIILTSNNMRRLSAPFMRRVRVLDLPGWSKDRMAHALKRVVNPPLPQSVSETLAAMASAKNVPISSVLRFLEDLRNAAERPEDVKFLANENALDGEQLTSEILQTLMGWKGISPR